MHEFQVRKFYLSDRYGELVAFIVCDPIYRDGSVIGYSPAIKRRSPMAPLGAEEALTKFAIERFRAEGLETFRLGLLPLYDIQRSEFRDAWPLRKVLQVVYQCGDRWLYSFRGHADFKRRYRGTFTKSYVATKQAFGNVYYVAAILKACRIA